MSYATDSGLMFYFPPQRLPATPPILAARSVLPWKLIAVHVFGDFVALV